MSQQNIVYLGGPDEGEEEILESVKDRGLGACHFIERRGIALGWIASRETDEPLDMIQAAQSWRCGGGILLKGAVSEALAQCEPDMERSYSLVEGLHDGDVLVQLMEDNGFFDRLDKAYQFIGGYSDESDRQGIEQLEFEVSQGGFSADNIWMKASWLSFDDEDASLRFRFSYGREGLEDVASDFQRESMTANLAENIFPESRAITQNESLVEKIAAIANIKSPAFVERIFYFNAPSGGAQFHHDVERGHDGVVYAQMFGSTAWLALSKPQLLDEIQMFLANEENMDMLRPHFTAEELQQIIANKTERQFWSDSLNNRDNVMVEKLLNHIPAFFKYLVDRNYGYILNAGDVILLPQAGLEDCCWHTVFCLDDFPGEALSFAIRESE